MNYKYSPPCGGDKYRNSYLKMRERLNYLSNLNTQSLNKNQRCTRTKPKPHRMKKKKSCPLSVMLFSHFFPTVPWQYHKKFPLPYKILSSGSHEETNWCFALNLWQCVSVWMLFLFSKTLIQGSRHKHVYVCEHTVYKHLLKEKNPGWHL